MERKKLSFQFSFYTQHILKLYFDTYQYTVIPALFNNNNNNNNNQGWLQIVI